MGVHTIDEMFHGSLEFTVSNKSDDVIAPVSLVMWYRHNDSPGIGGGEGYEVVRRIDGEDSKVFRFEVDKKMKSPVDMEVLATTSVLEFTDIAGREWRRGIDHVLKEVKVVWGKGRLGRLHRWWLRRRAYEVRSIYLEDD